MDNTAEGFESDPAKAATNIKKHKKKDGVGLSFEEASEVFNDEWAIEEFDENNSTIEESRFIVIGRVKSQLIVVVVYTPRNGKRRIISARPATSRERKVYYDRLGQI
jgi:hypothetical protein